MNDLFLWNFCTCKVNEDNLITYTLIIIFGLSNTNINISLQTGFEVESNEYIIIKSAFDDPSQITLHANTDANEMSILY